LLKLLQYVTGVQFFETQCTTFFVQTPVESFTKYTKYLTYLDRNNNNSYISTQWSTGTNRFKASLTNYNSLAAGFVEGNIGQRQYMGAKNLQQKKT